jgi:hypothetical protein
MFMVDSAVWFGERATGLTVGLTMSPANAATEFLPPGGCFAKTFAKTIRNASRARVTAGLYQMAAGRRVVAGNAAGGATGGTVGSDAWRTVVTPRVNP